MEYDNTFDIQLKRDYKVVKANEIIQRAKYDLNLQELKIMAYCFSMIKPNDTKETEYIFSINEFCQICGIDYKSGKNYASVKKCLTQLLSKTFWLVDPNGDEVSVHWLEKTKIKRGKGKISIRFDEDLQGYIFGLFENYTQYELLSTLPMTSRYSFRLYELLKSYEGLRKHTFDIDELKELLGAKHYTNFKDFRKKVLDFGTREINLYTDIEINYEPIYKGRKVIQVKFRIKSKDTWNRAISHAKANDILEGQMTIDDFV